MIMISAHIKLNDSTKVSAIFTTSTMININMNMNLNRFIRRSLLHLSIDISKNVY